MRHEKIDPHTVRRFPKAPESARFASKKMDTAMSSDTEISTEAPLARREVASGPRALDYFWRPRLAKLWWKGAACVWLGSALLAYFVPYNPLPHAEWAYFVLMLFHPFVIVPALGFRYARDWIAFAALDQDSDQARAHPYLYEGYGLGFHRNLDPTNPLDPRVNMLSNNPGSVSWHRRHGGKPF